MTLDEARKKFARKDEDLKVRHELMEAVRKTRAEPEIKALREFDEAYSGITCTCSKKECPKCFFWEAMRHVNVLSRELGWAESARERHLDAIYTHYYIERDGKFIHVGSWKPDPKLWPQAAEEQK